MASTFLVKTLIEGVQDVLQDRNPAFRRFPEIDLIRYLNYGRMALAKYLPQVSSRTDDIRLAVGAKQNLSRVLAANIKPGDGSTAVDTDGIAFQRALVNMGADGLTMGNTVRGPVERYTKDAYEPGWMTETGTAVFEIVFDKNHPLQFFVSPAVPVSPAQWLRVEWMANLPALPDGGAPGAEKYVTGGAQETTVLGVPDSFSEDLQNYTVALALTKGNKNMINLPKAQLHAGWFINSINQQVQAVSGVSPNIQMLPYLKEAV